MQKISLGTKIAPLGIQKLNCAEGSRCRAILVDPEVQVMFTAWDDDLNRRVACDEELMLRYGLKPTANYFMLVYKCNTDMNAQIVDASGSIEYIQLSANLYNDFADACTEVGQFTSLGISKVKKTAEGRDFSYLKVVPSNSAKIDAVPGLAAKLEQLCNDKDSIERCWQYIERSAAMTKEEYIAAKENTPIDSAPQIAPPSAPQIAPSAPKVSYQAPAVEDPFPPVQSDPFGGNDDPFGAAPAFDDF